MLAFLASLGDREVAAMNERKPSKRWAEAAFSELLKGCLWSPAGSTLSTHYHLPDQASDPRWWELVWGEFEILTLGVKGLRG